MRNFRSYQLAVKFTDVDFLGSFCDQFHIENLSIALLRLFGAKYPLLAQNLNKGDPLEI